VSTFAARFGTVSAIRDPAPVSHALLTFLQLSDIHLSGLPEGSVRDLDRKLRHRLWRDAQRRVRVAGGASGVLITGDVAFSGTDTQYEQAAGWLRDLCVRLGIPPWDVWVIPGNHDIQRSETRSPEQRNLRSAFRMEGVDIDQHFEEVLKNPTTAARLIAPLQNYNAFAAQFGCDITPERPFWTDEIRLTAGLRLCIRGMTSPLISDEHDNSEREMLALGTMQTTLLPETGDVYISLCHHPDNWLLDGAEAKQVIEAQVPFHVTGHEHRHDLVTTSAGVHLRTGALQPERYDPEEWEPRYNLITFDFRSGDDSTYLDIAVEPRVWDKALDDFAADAKYPGGVFRHSAVLTDIDDSFLPPVAQGVRGVNDRRRRLVYRTALLTPSDRQAAARAATVDADGIADLPEHAVPRTLVDRAAAAGRLRMFWDAVERLHGAQITEENPF
jgi:hypothetical protein